MIHLITKKLIPNLDSNIRQWLIKEDKPLYVIQKYLNTILDGDIILFSNGLHTNKDIEKIIQVFSDDMDVLSLSTKDLSEYSSIMKFDGDAYKEGDLVAIIKKSIRRSLRDISITSDFQKIVGRIIRISGGGTLYSASNRYIEPVITPSKVIEYNRRSSTLIEKVLKIKTNVGIGDFIYLKSLLDNVKYNYSNIYISLNDKLIEVIRDDEYRKFSKSFLKLLFNEPPYIITDDQTYRSYNVTTLSNEMGLQPMKPFLKQYLCDNRKISLPEYFVVVTTKVRGVYNRLYDKIRVDFINEIKRISELYPIVVMGEREIGRNLEYTAIKDSVFSIYNDIITNIDSSKIIDLSVPELGKTSPNIDNIIKDCTIMSRGIATICVGIGGNFGLSTSVSNKTICFKDPSDGEKISSLLYTRPNAYVSLATNIHSFSNYVTKDIIKHDVKTLHFNINLGVGSLIYMKLALDSKKDKYNAIYISPRKEIIDVYHGGDEHWSQFTDSLIKLLFSTPPYIITNDQTYESVDVPDLFNKGFEFKLKKLPQLSNKLTPDNLRNTEYVVISTKVRWFYKDFYKELMNKGFYKILNELSKKYKLVILGEREVEYNKEYENFKDHVYSIYPDIINNVDKSNIIDMSMKGYGISKPSLIRFKSDCSVLLNARYSITLGIGGNFCMSTVLTNTISLLDPQDPDKTSQFLFDGKKQYDNLYATRNISNFLNKIKGIYDMSESFGSLIDRLTTVNLKMWNNQELLYKIRKMTFDEYKNEYFETEDGAEVLWNQLKKSCDLNVQRNALIDDIDRKLVEVVDFVASGKEPEGLLIQNKHKTY